jgi:hypothetical protein
VSSAGVGHPKSLNQSAKNANERERDLRFMPDFLAAWPYPAGELPSPDNSLFLFAIFAFFAD